MEGIITTLITIGIIVLVIIIAVAVIKHKLNSMTRQYLGKWVFMGNNLILMGKDGNILGFESLSNIRKILFSPSEPDVPSGMADVPADQAYIVYPNPTQDILFVKGATDSTPIRIFSMDGLEVLSTVGSQVHVSQLPNATYLLQIGTQVARFIKQ